MYSYTARQAAVMLNMTQDFLRILTKRVTVRCTTYDKHLRETFAAH